MLRNGELIEACWQTVVVGEIIKLENDQFVAVFSSLRSWFMLLSSAHPLPSVQLSLLCLH